MPTGFYRFQISRAVGSGTARPRGGTGRAAASAPASGPAGAAGCLAVLCAAHDARMGGCRHPLPSAADHPRPVAADLSPSSGDPWLYWARKSSSIHGFENAPYHVRVHSFHCPGLRHPIYLQVRAEFSQSFKKFTARFHRRS